MSCLKMMWKCLPEELDIQAISITIMETDLTGIILKRQPMMQPTSSLREVSIGYTFPSADVRKWPGYCFVTCISLIGRNLLLFTDVPSIDPETFSIRNGIFVPGFESTAIAFYKKLWILCEHVGF